MTTIWMRAAHIPWICAYLKAARSFDARKNLSNLLIKGWLPELNCLPRESAVRFTCMLLGGQFPSSLTSKPLGQSNLPNGESSWNPQKSPSERLTDREF